MPRGLSGLVWSVVVVALFCLPLFAGLRGTDLRGDEAFYSFAVDRTLETNDWLIPKSSPHEDAPFLEKPPLKFWIVAGAMKVGLLPHDEFGMRFWDVLFSGMAFLYIVAIGRRLAGPVCGVVAVLVLFIHGPLLYEHGLRENNMEAPLFLSYCGGLYHYLVWASTERASGRRWHTIAVGLCFTLGFMVKFVAALFLPLILAVASLALPSHRTRLFRDWRLWSTSAVVALLLIVPWFVYAHERFGDHFWHVIFGIHVYDRMTVGLDPSHVHAAGFYFSQLYTNLQFSNVWPITVAGSVLLLIDTMRRRWSDGFVILLWFALPLALISLATSKLYYYAYPFLPPVGLAAGYLVARGSQYLQPLAERALVAVDQWVTGRWPSVVAGRQRPGLRFVFLAISAAAGALVVWTLAIGPVRIAVGDMVLLKNSSIFRPWIIAAAFGLLGGQWKIVGRVLTVPVVVLWVLPLPTYRASLPRLVVEDHPMRSARDCLTDVRAEIRDGSPSWRGLYVAGPASAFGHQHYYYFRGLRPWERDETPADVKLHHYLYDQSQQRPVLMDASLYGSFRTRLASGDIPALRDPAISTASMNLDDSVLLLPGPYARCGADGSP